MRHKRGCAVRWRSRRLCSGAGRFVQGVRESTGHCAGPEGRSQLPSARAGGGTGQGLGRGGRTCSPSGDLHWQRQHHRGTHAALGPTRTHWTEAGGRRVAAHPVWAVDSDAGRVQEPPPPKTQGLTAKPLVSPAPAGDTKPRPSCSPLPSHLITGVQPPEGLNLCHSWGLTSKPQ